MDFTTDRCHVEECCLVLEPNAPICGILELGRLTQPMGQSKATPNLCLDSKGA